MKTKSWLTLFIALSFALTSLGQTKTDIVKVKGFFFIPTPGTIPVDENGQPMALKRDTVFYLFAETSKRNIQWERAWHGGRSFSIAPERLTEEKTVAGEAKSNNEKIVILKTKGKNLWKLELLDDKQSANPPQKLKANSILLRLREKTKVFYTLLTRLTELASPLYQ